jgi:ElaB/YqjD/DUF883 family membrane-anchored ribosome-binding protein
MDTIKPSNIEGKSKLNGGAKAEVQKFDDTYHMLKDSVSEGAEEVKSLYSDIASIASEKGKKAVKATREYAHENPFVVAWGAAAVGLALGYFLTRSSKR